MKENHTPCVLGPLGGAEAGDQRILRDRASCISYEMLGPAGGRVEGKESDLGLEEKTLRNRNGPEIERGLEGKDEGECQGKDGDEDQRRKECWVGDM